MTKLEKLRTRLSEAKESAKTFDGIMLDERKLVELCLKCMHLCLPAKGKLDGQQALALQQSLEHLRGSAHSADIIYLNMYRVLANWDFIREGMRIPVWGGEPITSDVIFVGVRLLRQSEGAMPRYQVDVRLKTGIGAGIICGAALTAQAMQLFLDRISGCGKYNCTTEEIAGMQTKAVVSMKDGRLLFHDWKCTPEQKKKNRELAELRGDPCKCKYKNMCNTCRKTIEDCPLAVWLPKEKKDGTGKETAHPEDQSSG